MKYFTKLIGIIASETFMFLMAVIIGFSFASCDVASLIEDAGDDGDSGSSVVLGNTSWSGSIQGVSYELNFYSGGSGHMYITDGYNSEDGPFTWSLSGSRVTIHAGGAELNGTVSGSTMTLRDPGGNTMTLRKDSGGSSGGNDGGNSGGSVDLGYTAWSGVIDGYGYAFAFYPGGTGYVVIADGYDTEESPFTWTLSGNNVVIRAAGQVLTGTVSGSTMKLTDAAGNTMTLTKE